MFMFSMKMLFSDFEVGIFVLSKMDAATIFSSSASKHPDTTWFHLFDYSNAYIIQTSGEESGAFRQQTVKKENPQAGYLLVMDRI